MVVQSVGILGNPTVADLDTLPAFSFVIGNGEPWLAAMAAGQVDAPGGVDGAVSCAPGAGACEYVPPWELSDVGRLPGGNPGHPAVEGFLTCNERREFRGS